MAKRIAVNFNQRIWNGEVSQVATVGTTMLPLVNVAGGDWSFTNEPVYTLFASITKAFDFYSRDISTDSGHVLIIEESGLMLNHDRLDFLKADIRATITYFGLRHIPAIRKIP